MTDNKTSVNPHTGQPLPDDVAVPNPPTGTPGAAAASAEVASATKQAGPPQLSSAPSAQELAVRSVLETVMDPELGLSVIDLGLIREVHFLAGKTLVRMMLTTPFCPYAPQMMADVKQATESAVPQPAEVEILLAKAAQQMALQLDEVPDARRGPERDAAEHGEAALRERIVRVLESDHGRVDLGREEVHGVTAASVEAPHLAREHVARIDAERGVAAYRVQAERVDRAAVPPVLHSRQEVHGIEQSRIVEAGADREAGERALALLEHGRHHAVDAGEAARGARGRWGE